MSNVVAGPMRRCRANPHCPNMGPAWRVPAFVLGAPPPGLIVECSLCSIFVCAECAKHDRVQLPADTSTLAAWSLLCPRCGLALGAEGNEAVLHRAGSVVVARAQRTDSGWSLGMTNSSDDARAEMYVAAQRYLYALGASPSLDEAILMADKAIRESYFNRTALIAKALLCFKSGYRLAGDRAVSLLEGAPPDAEPSVVNAILRATARKGLAKFGPKLLQGLLERHQQDLVRARDAFSPCLEEAYGRLRRFRSGNIRLAEFMASLFPDRGNLPAAVASWFQALDLENSMDFERVERERSVVINLLVTAMSNEDIEELVLKSKGFRLGTLTYSSFYEYLKRKIDEYRVDLTGLGEFARYFDYIAFARRIDAVAFHGDVWDASWRMLGECDPSPSEWQLLREVENTHCIERLLNVLDGKPPDGIQGTYAPNATALQALADKSNEGVGTKRVTGVRGWLSRLLRSEQSS
jgi:hypothetical protein